MTWNPAATPEPLKPGMTVRDRAQLRGTILALTEWSDEPVALVSWANDHTGFIATRHLTEDPTP